MRCEEVRELLPAYVDRDLHPAGEIEIHLASCADCSAELASYSAMLSDLKAFRDRGEEPSPDLLERALALIPVPSLGARFLGSVQSHPVAYALASLGGAAMGATAIAIVLWRSHRVSEAG